MATKPAPIKAKVVKPIAKPKPKFTRDVQVSQMSPAQKSAYLEAGKRGLK